MNGVGSTDMSCTSLNISRFIFLKMLEIGNDCFTYVSEINLNGLNGLSKLESLKIGDNSFREMTGNFTLVNLPNLQIVMIGDNSLIKTNKVLTSNLPSLLEMSIGEGSLISFTE